MQKFRRTPFRCRNCQKRFYVYIPVEKDELEETTEPPETGSGAETTHNPDVAKPAEH